ncbi:MAG: repressor LexA [Acidobacteria bacterium]|nr:repressor LexA [Acidobacteriota bacterium]
MQPRTRRQKEVLEFITHFVEKHGYEPSYQQIAWHLGVSSKAGIARHIKCLESQGLITRRRENGSFNLELRSSNEVSEAVCRIEWLDVPIENAFVEDWECETLYVPKFLLGFQTPERLRAFRVPNDSMIEENIREGDVALVEKRSFARDGDIVVALTENKRAVLKQFYREGAKIELRPANSSFVSIMLAADKVSVEGVFRGLLRPFS